MFFQVAFDDSFQNPTLVMSLAVISLAVLSVLCNIYECVYCGFCENKISKDKAVMCSLNGTKQLLTFITRLIERNSEVKKKKSHIIVVQLPERKLRSNLS